jgi:hypothetical protein
MLTLGQAARLGTVPATGPSARHATPDVTDAELRYWISRAEESLSELKSALEERDAWEPMAQAGSCQNPARRCHGGDGCGGPAERPGGLQQERRACHGSPEKGCKNVGMGAAL